MLDVKFYNDRYWQSKYNFKDFIIDEKRFNHPIERGGIGLSVSKGYSLFCSYQKRNEKSDKKGPIGIRLLYYLQINAN